MSAIPICAVTGLIAGDIDACGDCDPCGAAYLVPEPVRKVLAEGEAWATKYSQAMERLDPLETAVTEFLAAEDEVEKEAARAEANGGNGWSSAPVVRRIYAVAALRSLTQDQRSKPRITEEKR